VAIEFCGPIAVAALGSRTRRDAAALALGAAGVLALADVHVAGNPGGFALAAAAGALWAAYIVLGHRLAGDAGIRRQDGLALGMAIGALGLAPVLVSSAVPALSSARLLAACLLVGVASSVVPYALEQIAMRRLPRARFALLLALLPATAALVGAAILGQVPGLVEGGGIALVVLAASLRSHATL
jgi:inner membrane transporter RhtA